MTREEIIDFCDMKAHLEPENEDVFIAIVKALEQEPQSFKWCTDCKEYDQEKHCCHRYSKVIRDTVAEIRQEPKTGEWIEHFDESGKWYECDQCHTDWGGAVNFCPNCGADMRR